MGRQAETQPKPSEASFSLTLIGGFSTKTCSYPASAYLVTAVSKHQGALCREFGRRPAATALDSGGQAAKIILV